MTDEELDRLQALADATSPGPWRARNRTYQYHVDVCQPDPMYLPSSGILRWFSVLGPALPHNQCCANADFIAAAHEIVPELIAEVRRLQAEVDLLRRRNLNLTQQLERFAERIAEQADLLSRRAEQ